jgi:hypothetical protein
MIDLGFTIKILFIVLVVFLFIAAWTETINRTLIQYFDLDKEEVSTWLKLAIGFTILLFLIVIGWNIEFHDLFGISETVDVELTGMKETFKNGKLKHYKAK